MNFLYTLIVRVVFVVPVCMMIISQSAVGQTFPGGDPLGGSISVYDSVAALYEDSKDTQEYPPSWEVPQENSPSAPHFIIVTLAANPRINDIPINQNDYIGGFYTGDDGELRCGGAKSWNDTANIIFALHKDDYDTPEKDGFSNGETIYFKLFSWTTHKEYDIDIMTFDDDGAYSATNIWYSMSISAVLDMQALVDMDFYINAEVNPICIGNQLFLSGEEFVGTSGPYTYSWSSNPSGFISDLQTPPQSLSLKQQPIF
jgi:hypothetical protein